MPNACLTLTNIGPTHKTIYEPHMNVNGEVCILGVVLLLL